MAEDVISWIGTFLEEYRAVIRPSGWPMSDSPGYEAYLQAWITGFEEIGATQTQAMAAIPRLQKSPPRWATEHYPRVKLEIETLQRDERIEVDRIERYRRMTGDQRRTERAAQEFATWPESEQKRLLDAATRENIRRIRSRIDPLFPWTRSGGNQPAGTQVEGRDWARVWLVEAIAIRHDLESHGEIESVEFRRDEVVASIRRSFAARKKGDNRRDMASMGTDAYGRLDNSW